LIFGQRGNHSGRLLLLLILLPAIGQTNQLETSPTGLFQNRFFTLSTDNSLICATSEDGYKTADDLLQVINFYEKNSVNLRQHAVNVLTDHTDERHTQNLSEFRADCANTQSPDLCVLEAYWDSKENALRALALFYDTKTIIKHSDDFKARRFAEDHLRIFEKGLRKIPAFLRQSISHAKPIENLDSEVEKLPIQIQTLVREAFPEDYDTSIWTDHTHPLMLVPGAGFMGETVAQVYSGQNLIIFTVKAFDKAKDGKMYRDIDLKYLVDFRLPILIHEIAHTIDNFHFWNGEDNLYFFYWYRKMSTDNHSITLIKNANLALWPSKWFEAFEYLWEVNDGRYDGRIQEKLAELVAQYILLPERLRELSPDAYAWLKTDVFRGIEYQGYDSCPNPVTKPLNFLEDAVAKVLGR
jgi:hypothetical protein